MAVYTEVTSGHLESFLAHYDIGAYQSHEGIAEGVSNTNYMLRTDNGRYILTLFEPARVKADDVPFFLSYADALQKGGVRSPEVIPDLDGGLVGDLCGRPACIMSFMNGQAVEKADITPDHCRKVGAALAQMHKIGGALEETQENRFGIGKWKAWFLRYRNSIENAKNGLGLHVNFLLGEIENSWPDDLPAGAIHADLFPDNVFFKNYEISGVIDFHFACTDLFVYDLAIAVNAWCFDRNIEFVKERFHAIIEGYQKERPLMESETKALSLMLRAAALRFLLSRLEEYVEHKDKDDVTLHSPRSFIKRLEFFIHDE